MELTPLEEFVRFVTSDVPLALDQLLTAFPVLQVKFSTKEDAGLNVLLFLFRKLVKEHHVLISALTVSTKCQQLNVQLVLLNAQLAQDQQLTVHHAFTDQFQLTDHAQFSVDKMNSVSEDSVLLALRVATGAKEAHRIVSHVLLDTSRLDLLAKKDVFLILDSSEKEQGTLVITHHSIKKNCYKGMVLCVYSDIPSKLNQLFPATESVNHTSHLLAAT